MPVVIAGAGAFGREVCGWIWPNRHVRGFIDDEKDDALSTIVGYVPKSDDTVAVAISDPHGREQVVALLGDIEYAKVFPERTSWCEIGKGCIFCPFTAVSSGAKVGNFVIANLHTTIGHDVEVGDFCTLSSHVDLCGRVKLGKRVFVGSHAVVMPGVTVGDDAKIGAGAVVFRDVPARATVYGNPAKMIKRGL